MIDDFAILVSTLLCVFVVWRAVTLDRVLPWYRPSAGQPAPAVSATVSQAAWVPDWEAPAERLAAWDDEESSQP